MGSVPETDQWLSLADPSSSNINDTFTSMFAITYHPFENLVELESKLKGDFQEKLEKLNEITKAMK